MRYYHRHMLWVPSAKQAWSELFKPDEPVRRLFLTVEMLDLIENDTDRVWAASAPFGGDYSIVRTAVEALMPTVWIYWERQEPGNRGEPIVLDFRLES